MRLRNKQGEDRWFAFSATADDSFFLALEGRDELKVLVPANETLTQRLFVTAPSQSAAAAAGHTDIRLWVEDMGSSVAPGSNRVHYDTVFNGKGQ